jgi:hypothetical protein
MMAPACSTRDPAIRITPWVTSVLPRTGWFTECAAQRQLGNQMRAAKASRLSGMAVWIG